MAALAASALQPLFLAPLGMRFIRLLFLGLVSTAFALRRAGPASPRTPIRARSISTRAIELLNPYGTWAKVGDKWAYTPLDHAVPYTNGRWLYSEYGWMWRGNSPTSWVTEHYGYWKRGADKVWAWVPGPELAAADRRDPRVAGGHWLAQVPEVDADGNFVEAPADRFTKTDEWTFVKTGRVRRTDHACRHRQARRGDADARTIDRVGPFLPDLPRDRPARGRTRRTSSTWATAACSRR